MLTEDQVRDLLLQAGETVHIDPAGRVTIAPRRRAWVVAGTAAAVAAVLVAFFVAVGPGRDGTRGTDPSQPGATTPATPPVRGDQLDDDQLPSVFGHTEETALALLQSRDLQVQVTYEDTCREVDGRALRTDPAVGTRFAPGDQVSLVVARAPANARCAYADRAHGWELLDFANGRGPVPAVAPELTLYFNDDEPIRLTAEAAADPADWGQVLTELAARSAEGRRLETEDGATWYAPELGVEHDDGDDFGCAGVRLGQVQASPRLPERPSTMYSVGIPIPFNGVSLDCFMVNVFRSGDTADGPIDTVVVRAWIPPEPTTVDVTPVVGMTEQGARTELESRGLEIEVVAPEERPDCTEGQPVVAEQEPRAISQVPAGSTVRLTMRWVPCGEAPIEEVARAFNSFAGGDDLAPPFAEVVRLYLGNQFQKSLTYDEAMDRANWEVCPNGTYAGRGCPFSALETLAAFDQRPTFRTFVADCMAEPLAETPTGLGSRMLVIGDAEPRTCAEDFSVQLWVEDNRITAVNLLLGVDP